MHREADIPERVRDELSSWFGNQVNEWQHIRTDVIRHALPEQLPGSLTPGYIEHDGILICGDHTTSASIEGAIISGKKTAAAIMEAS